MRSPEVLAPAAVPAVPAVPAEPAVRAMLAGLAVRAVREMLADLAILARLEGLGLAVLEGPGVTCEPAARKAEAAVTGSRSRWIASFSAEAICVEDRCAEARASVASLRATSRAATTAPAAAAALTHSPATAHATVLLRASRPAHRGPGRLAAWLFEGDADIGPLVLCAIRGGWGKTFPADIEEWIEHWNENPNSYVWTGRNLHLM